MSHIPCGVSCLTGQILIGKDKCTPDGYLEICCGWTGPLDAPRTLSKGGFDNYYFNNHSLAQSFVMRDGS